MKRLRLLFFLFSLLLFVGCDIDLNNSSGEVIEQTDYVAAKVSRVVDGDTIIVQLDNGNEERVRLLLIDTPESVHPKKPVQPFAIEASEFAKSMMTKGTEVKLEFDIGERDRYGRLLAYVWKEDIMVNELLLENGLARVAYVFEPNTKYVDRFYTIQKEAQSNGVGIWSIEDYVLENGFDEGMMLQGVPNTKDNDIASCSEPTIKGNHSSNGDRIFHVPEGQFYERTNPEELFCTEEEAELSGYRKSKS